MKVLIAGGGTFGHIAPGLAIYEEFKKRGDDVIYVVSNRDRGYKRIEELKDRAYVIPITPFKRFDLPAKIMFGFNLVRGVLASRRIIKRFKPDLIISSGGYVAAGPLIATRKNRKIKKVLLEQNTLPGAVTRMFSKYADLTVLTFASSEKWINGKSEVIGNPVLFDKSTIDIKKARDAFNIKEGDFVLTVTGGSGGAKIINDTFLKIASSLKEIKVIWSTGVNNFEEIKEGAKDYPNISVYAFIDKMDELLSISNLVLSRAGATSIAELSYMGVPGVLIPYKWAAENHQVLNAEFVINGGGGVMIEDDNLSEELLLKTLNELINNKKKLEKMASDMGSLFGSDIKERIVDLIKREICTA